MKLYENIISDPNICNGKPTFQGTRITVNTILEFLSNGSSREEILYQYPKLTEKDIDNAILFASNMINHGFLVQELD